MQADEPEVAFDRRKLIDDAYLPSIELLMSRIDEVTTKIIDSYPHHQEIGSPGSPVEAIVQRLLDLSDGDWAYSCLDHEDCRHMTNVPLELLIHSVSTEEYSVVLTMLDLTYRRFLDRRIMTTEPTLPSLKPEATAGRWRQRVERTPLRRLLTGRSKRELDQSTQVAQASHVVQLKSECTPERKAAFGRLMKIDKLRMQMCPTHYDTFSYDDRKVAHAVRLHVAERQNQYELYVPTPGLADELGIHESILAVVWLAVVSGHYKGEQQAQHCAWARSTRLLIKDIIDLDVIASSNTLGCQHLRVIKSARS